MTPDDLILSPRGLRFRGQYFPCSIGRGGIRADKREGDGATPVGRHQIVGVYFRPDRIPAPVPWAMPIGPNDLWSDEPAAPEYNHHVRAPYAPSHEALRRSDPLYDLILVTDWNWPDAIPGKGSAIFLHQWRRPGYPTEGCVAFRRDHLLWIAQNLSPDSHLIVRG